VEFVVPGISWWYPVAFRAGWVIVVPLSGEGTVVTSW
jgi:hypothetical protein